jgi:glycosyltransferase involved in cell wall biosynthesis
MSGVDAAVPTVSVVIAVKNAERYLAECLESVTAQTFQDFEILVVDGHSTDRTEAIARAHAKVRFLQQNGTGFQNAWNSGIRAAKGRTIAFLDSDDVWTPIKLEVQVAMLDADPSLEAVIGKMRFFMEPGEIPPPGFRDRVLGQDHIAQMPGVLMARPRLFEKIGLWGEDWQIASDIDWFLKLKDSRLPVGIVPELLLHKRVHSRNLSYVTASDRIYPTEVLRLLHESIERKRAAAGTK